MFDRQWMQGIGRVVVLIAAALLQLTVAALAQTTYPEQPVKIVVGFPPGVAPDVVARLLADKFSVAWGKPVIVENVGGAGGNIATDRVAKAAPDGYTLLMGGNAALVTGERLRSATRPQLLRHPAA